MFSIYRFIPLLLIAAVPNGIAAPPLPLTLIDQLYCPAELLVVQGDSKKYAKGQINALEKTGLKLRLVTAMSTLPWLCRRYVEVSEASVPEPEIFIEGLRDLQTLVSDEELASLPERIEAFVRKAPFQVDQFTVVTEQSIEEAKLTYEQYCRGCHENTNMASTNPAYSLFNMASTQSAPEFLARMLLGVRGTSEIGLSNPLTISEIGAMRRYFLSPRTN